MRVIESREIFINVYLTNKDIPTHLLLFCKLMFTQLLSQHPFFFFFFLFERGIKFFKLYQENEVQEAEFLSSISSVFCSNFTMKENLFSTRFICFIINFSYCLLTCLYRTFITIN